MELDVSAIVPEEGTFLEINDEFNVSCNVEIPAVDPSTIVEDESPVSCQVTFSLESADLTSLSLSDEPKDMVEQLRYWQKFKIVFFDL